MCSSYSRFDEPGDASKGDIYKILFYASLAASSHNTQPWKVEVYGTDSIVVLPDFSRKLHVVDPHSRELFISLGAFIENMDIAANHFGYTATIRVNTKDEAVSDSTFITVSIRKEVKKNLDISELEHRRVLRGPYDTLSIADSVVQQLTLNSSAVHFIPANSEKGEYIKWQTIEAYTRQANSKEAQDELAQWIRFSKADAREKRDGLTTAGMEIKGIAGFVVQHLFKPGDSKKKSFVSAGIEKTRIQAEHCGGWILVTQKENTPECWINTGRIIERMNLKCYRLKIGFHPISQMIEEADFEKPANKLLGFGGTIQFVARIGYVKDYSKPVSMRRTVESFTVFK